MNPDYKRTKNIATGLFYAMTISTILWVLLIILIIRGCI